jgi:Mn2+/Fe2+ NRAMP family transporter
MAGATFVVILFFCGLSAALVARWKGNSVLIWFLIGFGLPIIGTVAAYLYRSEKDEARRECPACGRVVPITAQMCLTCGEDLDYPEELLPPRSAVN